MLLFYLLCITAVVTWAEMPYENFDIKIVNELSGTLEALAATEKFLNEEKQKQEKDAMFGVLSVIPYIGSISTPLSALEGAMDGASLIKTNTVGHEHDMAENDIRTIQASMQTISQNMAFLKDHGFTDDSKTTMIHSIHDNLDTIVNRFDHPHAIFRRHPLLAVRPLFSIASFVAVFRPIMKAIVPRLAENTHLPCKVFNTLLAYRPLVVHARLDKINADSISDVQWRAYKRQNFPMGHPTHYNYVSNIMVDVIRKSYNARGYNEKNVGVVRCTNRTTSGSGDGTGNMGSEGGIKITRWPGDIFLTDHVNRNTYFSNYIGDSSWETCFRDYMELVRFRTEGAFDASLNLVRDIECKPRYPTGDGWLTLTIQRVLSYGEGSERCDKRSDMCDPFVKIILNGDKVYQTSELTNNAFAVFMETYTSEKISHQGNVRLEVWDHDDFLYGDDDQMMVVDRAIGAFGANDRNSYGGIVLETNAVWKPEYSFEPPE